MLTDGKQQRINLLSELSPEELQKLLKNAVVENYDRYDILFLPGDSRRHIHIVIKGIVKLARLSPDGREIIITTVKAGEMFGELALISAGEHDTMAEMMTKGKIAAVGIASFQELLEQLPKLSFLVARLMGMRRMLLESKLEDLAFRNVPERLAKFLLEEAADSGRADGGSITLRSQYSQQEIGSMIGSTRETTSHFLNDFRRSGLIDFNKRLISILDPTRLAELSGVI